MTNVDISSEAKLSRVHVSRLRTGAMGKHISYSLYARLHALWRERCPDKQANEANEAKEAA